MAREGVIVVTSGSRDSERRIRAWLNEWWAELAVVVTFTAAVLVLTLGTR